MERGEIYHIFNKSIAEYKIFNNKEEFLRMMKVIQYYLWGRRKIRFSKWKEIGENRLSEIEVLKEEKLVEIIAYCIMPTHIHLILKQLRDKGISIFMSQISNSYARYFNVKHKRKGPLWEREFKNVLIATDGQLLHLTRYIHLNPTTAFLVDKPEDWLFSSYKEFIGEVSKKEKICNFENFIDIDVLSYKKFVEDRISYQRDLGKIKNLMLE
ncbi:MAG: hypothetical protein COT38_01720 [Candidatus Omnitrophica bacterium CG08_land_8_20_14_0_20_41_16]|uniref:Transposase IS200-like domain-containing protein n=1 Tax=Candidatus Sherwoodlollariibacterium unditelluris TaxID=1974757 RepID=A0A2G9YJE4_9BACT|nr:MAG: hypothetical protein COX41_03380 [Candidatus Omnitrophica bacterium CG23_combo_of_CG06-09_8_20_14_all_41_10]PIS34132.1 MAG: hypothetical protein COT38_01720 [Candidatus Omnitrophica bacterium CG08_land_8_20_14_0_20_41_16]